MAYITTPDYTHYFIALDSLPSTVYLFNCFNKVSYFFYYNPRFMGEDSTNIAELFHMVSYQEHSTSGSLVPRVNSNLSGLIGYIFPLVDTNPVANQ